MSLSLEQDTQSLKHIGLIVGNQDSAHGITMNCISGAASILQAMAHPFDPIRKSLGTVWSPRLWRSGFCGSPSRRRLKRVEVHRHANLLRHGMAVLERGRPPPLLDR